MNKLHLLRKLNDDGLFACLTSEELHLFLLMIAGSTENGEGEILLGRIRWIFGKDFSSERLKDVCSKLEKKRLVRITYHSELGAKRHGLAVTYRILRSRTSGLVEVDPGNK